MVSSLSNPKPPLALKTRKAISYLLLKFSSSVLIYVVALFAVTFTYATDFTDIHTPIHVSEESKSNSANTQGLSENEQTSLWDAFTEARRYIRPVEDFQKKVPNNEQVRYLAYNPKQRLHSQFLDQSLRLFSGLPNRDWSGTIRFANTSGKPEIVQTGTMLQYQYDNGVTEWYENRSEGIEHGFIIQSDSTLRTSEPLRIPIIVTGLKVESVGGFAKKQSDLQFVNDHGEVVVSYEKLKVWDANGVVLAASMLPTATGLEISIDDQNAHYPVTVDPMILSQEAKLTPTPTGNGASGEAFGCSVSVSGDTALIGAKLDDGTGSAYVFVNDGNSWLLQQRLLASDAQPGDYFGSSVSVSGDIALIGAANSNTSGCAYIFVRSDSTWTQEQKLTSNDGATFDRFGEMVSISGEIAFVGVSSDDDNGTSSGSAYIFVRGNDSTWSQEQKLVASDAAAGDKFGIAVSLSGTTALIGANANDDNGSDSGCAYIFVRNGTTWSQQTKLLASDAAASDFFGGSASLSGNTAIIGASSNDDNGSGSGSAYIFVRNGTAWSQQTKLLASDAAEYDFFGKGVSIDGDTAVVGATGEDYDRSDSSGSAYIFVRNGTIWSQQQKITAPIRSQNDLLGSAVSISGDTVLCGVLEDDDNGTGSGNTYVYIRNGSTWSNKQTITAGESKSWTDFGYSVSVWGDTALIGARDFSGGGNGYSGSAYLFKRNGTTWKPWQRLTVGEGEDEFGYSVSLFENTALIGAPRESNAYVYVLDGSIWNLEQKLTALDGESSDQFGSSVSIYNNTALVGAMGDGLGSGSVYIYERSGSTWTETLKITNGTGGRLGNSVSLSGDTAVMGSYRSDSPNQRSGSAFIYVKVNTSWIFQQQLTVSGAESDSYIGYSVSLFEDTVLLGAYGDSDMGNGSGCVYVFKRNGSFWDQEQKLTATDGAALDHFGNAVSLYGDTALIGAPFSNDNGSNSGSAYVFTRNGSTWSQQSKFLASEGASGDEFGYSVSLWGDTALVGAVGDDGIDTGGNITTNQGSAYVYRVDSDGDRLIDSVETNSGAYVSPSDSGTDPKLSDTDSDGYFDGAEVAAGSDPTIAQNFPDSAVFDQVDGFAIGILSRSGNTYQAEYSNDLKYGIWVPLNNVTLGTGAHLNLFIAPEIGSEVGYWRVLETGTVINAMAMNPKIADATKFTYFSKHDTLYQFEGSISGEAETWTVVSPLISGTGESIETTVANPPPNIRIIELP